jgi:uncharacterized membrane protein YjjP (DUF1212 family)
MHCVALLHSVQLLTYHLKINYQVSTALSKIVTKVICRYFTVRNNKKLLKNNLKKKRYSSYLYGVIIFICLCNFCMFFLLLHLQTLVVTM